MWRWAIWHTSHVDFWAIAVLFLNFVIIFFLRSFSPFSVNLMFHLGSRLTQLAAATFHAHVSLLLFVHIALYTQRENKRTHRFTCEMSVPTSHSIEKIASINQLENTPLQVTRHAWINTAKRTPPRHREPASSAPAAAAAAAAAVARPLKREEHAGTACDRLAGTCRRPHLYAKLLTLGGLSSHTVLAPLWHKNTCSNWS